MDRNLACYLRWAAAFRSGVVCSDPWPAPVRAAFERAHAPRLAAARRWLAARRAPVIVPFRLVIRNR